jgi:Domain of unknown function (DUF1707)
MCMMGGMPPAGPGDEAAAGGERPARREASAPPAQQVTPGQLRASHQDRDRVVEILRVAAGDGRLTSEELDQRLEVALTARTFGELAALTTDLPAAGHAVRAVEPEPKDVIRLDCQAGSAKRDGPWVVPRRIEVKVTSGAVKLDFTEAVISQPLLKIDADVRSGSLLLVTKPGILVDADEVTVRSGEVKVRAPWGADVPVTLRLEVSGTVGSGSIQARPPRRSFWQWLMRRPRRYALASG